MKLVFSMKDPDGVYYACDELKDCLTAEGKSEDEVDDAVEKFKKHFSFSEYLAVSYDTETDELKINK